MTYPRTYGDETRAQETATLRGLLRFVGLLDRVEACGGIDAERPDWRTARVPRVVISKPLILSL